MGGHGTGAPAHTQNLPKIKVLVTIFLWCSQVEDVCGILEQLSFSKLDFGA